MHSGNITIENITKIEGNAGLSVEVENGKVKSLKFMIKDYRRFYTEAVKGKPFLSAPSFLSRICGTCSVAHLFASIEAVERSQGIEVTEQTKILRKLAYDGLMIRDHALHLYFFVLPDVLGIDSILDIPEDHDNPGHILLHDSFDIKRVGSEITDVVIGAAIHAPFPVAGGFLKLPDTSKFPELIEKLEKIRPQVLRGIKTFFDWKAELIRNSDYMALRNDKNFDFIDGMIVNSTGLKVEEEQFHDFLRAVVIPYSQAEGYVFSEVYEDYLVGSLARINFNKDLLKERTKKDVEEYLKVFPSNNVYHNNLAQAIEILQCVDEAIDILKTLKINNEKFVRKPSVAGRGVGVIEAPRGILYHMAETNDKGIITDYDVIVPTSQNQINIENDLKKYFNENLDKDKEQLRLDAEKIIRAYDPCMSCATNFLKLEWKEL
ncbi:Ni/Fe hydrogenase subunit alpha [candidate division WWE3 bacterium]|uniref:Ni/Fe hydrogenase subunit alpha n=1 Tax=candidate division WWE3 bacterium TaxID=2053526 RepID=A0A7X9DJS1_UNCKA|nr:Ni/Fe hydrogenase subunit alpha [candidate division WWE3 bacterium]